MYTEADLGVSYRVSMIIIRYFTHLSHTKMVINNVISYRTKKKKVITCRVGGEV